MRNLVHIVVKRFLHIKRFVNIVIYNFALLHSDNPVAYAVLKKLDRRIAHLGCHNTVADGRVSASLNMTQNRSP